MTTLGEAAFILKRLADAYSKPVSNETVRAYHSVLQRFPRLVLAQATMRLMESSRYFPRISEIVKEAEPINRNYYMPECAKVDECMYWYLYTHNLSSTDELTDEDVQKINQEFGIEQIRSAMPAKELSSTEVREICKARGLPVSRRVEQRQAEPVLN